jgi:hypothetical protein
VDNSKIHPVFLPYFFERVHASLALRQYPPNHALVFRYASHLDRSGGLAPARPFCGVFPKIFVWVGLFVKK